MNLRDLDFLALERQIAQMREEAAGAFSRHVSQKVAEFRAVLDGVRNLRSETLEPVQQLLDQKNEVLLGKFPVALGAYALSDPSSVMLNVGGMSIDLGRVSPARIYGARVILTFIPEEKP